MKKGQEKKIVRKCTSPFLKHKPFWIKAKEVLYLPGESLSLISQMLCIVRAEIPDSSQMQSHVDVFMPYGCFQAMHLHD